MRQWWRRQESTYTVPPPRLLNRLVYSRTRATDGGGSDIYALAAIRGTATPSGIHGHALWHLSYSGCIIFTSSMSARRSGKTQSAGLRKGVLDVAVCEPVSAQI